MTTIPRYLMEPYKPEPSRGIRLEMQTEQLFYPMKPRAPAPILPPEPKIGIRAVPPPAVRVFESPHATIEREDWSGCRSPSRAARRERQGHRQRVVRTREPAGFMVDGRLVVHPEIARRLRQELGRSVEESLVVQIEPRATDGMEVTTYG